MPKVRADFYASTVLGERFVGYTENAYLNAVFVHKTLRWERQASFLKVEITVNQGHDKQTEAERHRSLLVKYSFTSLIVLEFVGPK